MADDDEDCWDAFGSDDEEDDNDDQNMNRGGIDSDVTSRGESQQQKDLESAAAAISVHLSQNFLKRNAQVRLTNRVVGLAALQQPPTGCDGNNLFEAIRKCLEQRGMHVVHLDSNGSPNYDYFDAIIVGNSENLDHSKLLPGGIVIVIVQDTNQVSSLSDAEATIISDPEIHDSYSTIYKSPAKKIDHVEDTGAHHIHVFGQTKRVIRAHTSTCQWLSSSASSIAAEHERLHQATIALSVSEVREHKLTESSLKYAVHALSQYGYCVIRNLLEPKDCITWGTAVIESVHDAASILLKRDKVDIYHPHTSEFEPQAYRELSMREDLRLDLRHGPSLWRLRERASKDDNQLNLTTSGNIVIKASTKSLDNCFLRGNESILEIIRRTMNPKSESLYKGNVGRYNFSGSGPDGSYQDLRTSPVGGIVSFPGAADQAIHADTPHLFEHIPDLPAHYINMFTPGVPFDEDVGGTAFVHGSHNLRFTATYYDEGSGGGAGQASKSSVYRYLVRPRLNLGDVLLFDCRILHFGLANRSSSVERVMLYSNTTHAWFHDPKNWDNQRRIFDDSIAI